MYTKHIQKDFSILKTQRNEYVYLYTQVGCPKEYSITEAHYIPANTVVVDKNGSFSPLHAPPLFTS